jgi:hypothetical protein
MRIHALVWQARAQVSHLEVWLIHRIHRDARLSLPLLAFCSVSIVGGGKTVKPPFQNPRRLV